MGAVIFCYSLANGIPVKIIPIYQRAAGVGITTIIDKLFIPKRLAVNGKALYQGCVRQGFQRI